jgi:2-dehydropantoate 2-reductase
MHFLIYGAGAVGAYFGAALLRGGGRVTFVARGANLAALQEYGLTVRLPHDTWRIERVTAVDDPRAAAAPDVVLVAVKSYDTTIAARALRPVVTGDTLVLSLQNGIENERILAAALDMPPLLVALTFIGVELTAPADVTYTARGELIFGEPDGTLSARGQRLAAALAAANVPHQFRSDIQVMAWEKLAWNTGFNGVTTLTGTTVAEVLADPHSREVVLRAMEEVDAVAIAQGIPVRRRRLAAVLADSGQGLPDFPTSMLQDLRRDRPLEYDAITGAVLRAADRAGVAVPVNRTLYALLARLDRHARPAAAPS